MLRELCCICKAPQSFSPAIRQWKILVELCAGILSSSHFVLVLDGFRRLVPGWPKVRGLEANRCPTNYSALAEAILTMAQVTTKKLASVTFSGGLDCMWLAAVAEWIFSLDVIIYSSTNAQLYRSRSLDEQPPQITIVYLEKTETLEEQSFVSEKSSLIRSGRTLFVYEDKSSLGERHFFNWRSSWSTILHDTFHESIDQLLSDEIAYQFGLYIYCVSMVQEPDLRFKSDYDSPQRTTRIFSNNLVDPLVWTQDSSRGHKFLSFASKRLPELSRCLAYDFSSIPQNQLLNYGLDARAAIERKSGSHDIYSTNNALSIVPLMKLAEVIILFLWMTLVSDIDEDIAPSVTGLSNLCRWVYTVDDPNQHPFMRLDGQQARQTALVFYVLSGLTVDSEDQAATPSSSSNYLAMAGAGVCVSRQALTDPNLPPDSLFKVRVVSGYISHDGAVFRRIRNLSGRRHPSTFSFDASSTCQSVDAIVQVTDRDSELAMAYQVDYIDSRRKRKYLLINIGRLLRILQSSISLFRCDGGCPVLPGKFNQNFDLPDMDQIVSSWRETRRYPVVIFDRADTSDAQRLVENLKLLSYPWVFASTDPEFGPLKAGLRYCQVEVLIDRPFLIYLSIMNPGRAPLCLFPFTPCLRCMIERGCLVRMYEHFRETMPSTGSLTLAGPRGTEHD